MILLEEEMISVKTLGIILGAFVTVLGGAFGIMKLLAKRGRSNGNRKTEYITRTEFETCKDVIDELKQWTKDVSFTQTNEEGVEVHYVRGSTQKPLEELVEELRIALKIKKK